MSNLETQQLSPIGILLPPGIDYVVAMFAAMQCGAGFVPLDVNFPIDRLAYMVSSCRIKKIVSDIVYKEIYEQLNIERIVLCQSRSKRKSLCQSKSRPSSLAYLVFTSGTTGNPKGIPITHQNLLPLMHWQKQHFALGTTTRMAQTLSLTFDFGIQEVLTTILFGGTLIIPEAKQRLSAEAYLKFLNDYKINTLYTTPTHLSSLLNYGQLDYIQFLLVGGEKFDGKLFNDLKTKTLSSCKIINGYGPSEVTINVAMYFADHSTVLGNEESLPIGTPSANNKVYILDSDGWLVPNKVPGEIFLGGVGVAQGYINNEEQTARAFINHDFLNLGNLYRTGDYGHFDDGLIVFRNRQDTQRKINGYRVELNEIIKQFETIADIKKAHVMLLNEQGIVKIVGFYSSISGHPINEESIRSHLVRRLPFYMLPNSFIWLQEFPLNKNNKIADDKLKIYFQNHLSCEQINVDQENATLNRIITLWKKVLNITQIDAHSDLFSFGVTSLTLSHLHQMMEQELAISLSLSSLFHYTTPLAITEMISKQSLIIAPATVNYDHVVMEKRQQLNNLRKRYQTVYEMES